MKPPKEELKALDRFLEDGIMTNFMRATGRKNRTSQAERAVRIMEWYIKNTSERIWK